MRKMLSRCRICRKPTVYDMLPDKGGTGWHVGQGPRVNPEVKSWSDQDRVGMSPIERGVMLICAVLGFVCWQFGLEGVVGAVGGAICLGWLVWDVLLWDVWTRSRNP